MSLFSRKTERPFFLPLRLGVSSLVATSIGSYHVSASAPPAHEIPKAVNSVRSRSRQRRRNKRKGQSGLVCIEYVFLKKGGSKETRRRALFSGKREGICKQRATRQWNCASAASCGGWGRSPRTRAPALPPERAAICPRIFSETQLVSRAQRLVSNNHSERSRVCFGTTKDRTSKIEPQFVPNLHRASRISTESQRNLQIRKNLSTGAGGREEERVSARIVDHLTVNRKCAFLFFETRIEKVSFPKVSDVYIYTRQRSRVCLEEPRDRV